MENYRPQQHHREVSGLETLLAAYINGQLELHKLLAPFPTNNMADDLSVYLARLAVVDHFDQTYGKNVARIEAWQELCRDVGAEVGNPITQCKKVINAPNPSILEQILTGQESQGNLCQHRGLCASQERGQSGVHIGSAKALSRYIKKHGRAKVFPLHMAKENLILRWTLIELH
jgi:hypothetical protein